MEATAVPTGTRPPAIDDRCCVICGGSLEELDESAEVCGAKCRRRRSRLRRLLAGERPDGYRSVADLVSGLEMTCKEPAKIRRVTRTDVARRFISLFVIHAPGEVVPAETLRTGYLRWHRELGDGSPPLGRVAFDDLVKRLEVAESIGHERTGGRGRPRTVFVGIRLADPPGLS